MARLLPKTLPASPFTSIHVDYATQARTRKPVADFYRGVIAQNAVTPSPRDAALEHFETSALDAKVDDW